MPPLGPGMAPLMSSSPRSASTAWTVRFWVVVRTSPIRPAIRMPLKTRPGVDAPPMEPGLRWLRCEPWEALTPWKPWRFITPAVPLPLLVRDDVDDLPGLEQLGGDLLAERVLAGVVGAQLDQVAPRRHARLGEVARLAAW